MPKMQTNLSLDENLLARVEIWAKADNRNLSNAVETLLIRVLDQIDKEKA